MDYNEEVDVRALKPCPWCGETKNLYFHERDNDPNYVECTKCRVDGPLADDLGTAILAWETRLNESVSDLDKLDDAIESFCTNENFDEEKG